MEKREQLFEMSALNCDKNAIFLHIGTKIFLSLSNKFNKIIENKKLAILFKVNT